MKIALFGDSHCGARNDNDFYIRHQERFFGDVFFPTLEAKGITTVCHVGDLNDKRRAINIKSLRALNHSFIHPIIGNEYDYWQLLGNHDIFYKNTRELSSVVELFGAHEGPNFHIVKNPQTINFDGLDVFMCPWLVPDEIDILDTILNQTSAKVCFGHFEMVGFQLMRNVLMTHGMDPDVLKQFEVVISGHYHTPSHQSNVMYIGAPYQMSYADIEDRKRFIIFDTDNYGLEIVYNDDLVFKQCVYDDSIDPDQFDYDEFHDVNLKLIVNSKDDVGKYNKFFERLEKAKPFTLTTLDRYVFTQASEEIADADKDTLELLVESVEDMDILDERKPKIQSLFEQLYIEACSG